MRAGAALLDGGEATAAHMPSLKKRHGNLKPADQRAATGRRGIADDVGSFCLRPKGVNETPVIFDAMSVTNPATADDVRNAQSMVDGALMAAGGRPRDARIQTWRGRAACATRPDKNGRVRQWVCDRTATREARPIQWDVAGVDGLRDSRTRPIAARGTLYPSSSTGLGPMLPSPRNGANFSILLLFPSLLLPSPHSGANACDMHTLRADARTRKRPPAYICMTGVIIPEECELSRLALSPPVTMREDSGCSSLYFARARLFCPRFAAG